MVGKRGKENLDSLSLVKGVMFFFDIVLAMLIITMAGSLLNNSLGTSALLLGFVMLSTTVLMKIREYW